jgi:tripeptidyl-peptidase I
MSRSLAAPTTGNIFPRNRYTVAHLLAVTTTCHLLQVEAYVKPTQASVDAVNTFLQSNGINATTLSPAGDWLGFSVPVSKANDIFDANFSVYKHAATGEESIRTLSYSIPSSLQGHLDVVHPTTTCVQRVLYLRRLFNQFVFRFTIGNGTLPLKLTPLKKNGTATNASGPQPADVPSSCNLVVTPACIEDLYGIPTVLATQSSNQLAVAGYGQQYAQQAELTVRHLSLSAVGYLKIAMLPPQSFLATLRPDLDSDTTFSLDTIDGGSNPQGPGVYLEAVS